MFVFCDPCTRAESRQEKHERKLYSSTSDTLYSLFLACPVRTWEAELMTGHFLTYCRFCPYFIVCLFFSPVRNSSPQRLSFLWFTYHVLNLWNIFLNFKEARWKKVLQTDRPMNQLRTFASISIVHPHYPRDSCHNLMSWHTSSTRAKAEL